MSTKNQVTLLLPLVEYEKARLLYRAIAHPVRREIIEYIARKQEASPTVTELFVSFRMEQSIMSQHLAILRECGLLKSERVGKNILYMVNEPVIHLANETSKALKSKLAS